MFSEVLRKQVIGNILNDTRIDKPQGHFTEIGFMWEDSFEYKFYHCGEVIGCHTEPKYPLIFETDDLPIN